MCLTLELFLRSLHDVKHDSRNTAQLSFQLLRSNRQFPKLCSDFVISTRSSDFCFNFVNPRVLLILSEMLAILASSSHFFNTFIL